MKLLFRYLLFHLQQQKLIELIRDQRVDEAIEFAQNHLAERGEEDPKVPFNLSYTIIHQYLSQIDLPQKDLSNRPWALRAKLVIA